MHLVTPTSSDAAAKFYNRCWRWMINNNLTDENALPGYNVYIYTNGLREVNAEAVNIR